MDSTWEMVDFLVGLHLAENLWLHAVIGPADVEGEGVDGGVVEGPVHDLLAEVLHDGVLGVGDVHDYFVEREFLLLLLLLDVAVDVFAFELGEGLHEI